MIRRYLKFVQPYKWRIIATIIIGIIKFGIPMLIPLLAKYCLKNSIGGLTITKINAAIPRAIDNLVNFSGVDMSPLFITSSITNLINNGINIGIPNLIIPIIIVAMIRHLYGCTNFKYLRIIIL